MGKVGLLAAHVSIVKSADRIYRITAIFKDSDSLRTDFEILISQRTNIEAKLLLEPLKFMSSNLETLICMQFNE